MEITLQGNEIAVVVSHESLREEAIERSSAPQEAWEERLYGDEEGLTEAENPPRHPADVDDEAAEAAYAAITEAATTELREKLGEELFAHLDIEAGTGGMDECGEWWGIATIPADLDDDLVEAIERALDE